jgi:serine/threonine-protein kinase HipA
MSVIDFFQLKKSTAETIKTDVLTSVSQWQAIATTIGISRGEQQLLAAAFNV